MDFAKILPTVMLLSQRRNGLLLLLAFIVIPNGQTFPNGQTNDRHQHGKLSSVVQQACRAIVWARRDVEVAPVPSSPKSSRARRRGGRTPPGVVRTLRSFLQANRDLDQATAKPANTTSPMPALERVALQPPVTNVHQPHAEGPNRTLRGLSVVLLTLSLACLLTAVAHIVLAAWRSGCTAQHDGCLRAMFVVPLTSCSTTLGCGMRTAYHAIWSTVRAVHSRAFARETSLQRAVELLQSELQQSEQQIRTSALEITYCRGLLERRAGMLASLLLPGERSKEGDYAIHQRKLAELLSLVLDVLNWKLGQGAPISRRKFWEV